MRGARQRGSVAVWDVPHNGHTTPVKVCMKAYLQLEAWGMRVSQCLSGCCPNLRVVGCSHTATHVLPTLPHPHWRVQELAQKLAAVAKANGGVYVKFGQFAVTFGAIPREYRVMLAQLEDRVRHGMEVWTCRGSPVEVWMCSVSVDVQWNGDVYAKLWSFWRHSQGVSGNAGLIGGQGMTHRAQH